MTRLHFLSRTERRIEAGAYLAIVILIVCALLLAHLLATMAPWAVKWLALWLAVVALAWAVGEWLIGLTPREPEEPKP